MQEKINKDLILTNIINICYASINDDISHITDEQLLMCCNFINTEITYINNLKNDLKVPTYIAPFYEIENNLDIITMSNSVLSENPKVTFYELSKDINYLENILFFCDSILVKIIKDRKIIN